MDERLRLGIDIGSTTVKLAVIDDDCNLLYGKYERHFSNIQETLHKPFSEASKALPGARFSAMITGSGGLSIANWIGVTFIQEVVAVYRAVETYSPETDVAIEIGGEDAKIIYFRDGPDQRMNGICAGGTGSFIDQMAALLQTDAQGLNDLAKTYKVIYPIAARCGVFAKSDIQPLINEGAAKPDLAISIFNAIVSQTISGLACGKPIKGSVAFLGGPLHFLTELRKRFEDVLKLAKETSLTPENSHLFAALGAAIACAYGDLTFDKLIYNLINNKQITHEINRLEPLFEGEADYAAFRERHDTAKVGRAALSRQSGPLFLGIDAGSTTTKLAAINEKGDLVWSYYAGNQANPLKVVIAAVKELYAKLPKDAYISRACSTGYGEGLAKEALRLDMGEIETVAHYRAAAFFAPDVDFILDIGGQDMKCIRVNDGVIDNVLLNEACSAGCGSFIETFAKSLGFDAEGFAKTALYAKSPIDLGSRCTVFMNSRVKQAQKEGAHVSDIAAGLAYSVIKNAIQKVIKITDPIQMGKSAVVQGGTFYNDAVLRAFERISGKEAKRPDISGLMGAFGAALCAAGAADSRPYVQSNMLNIAEIEALDIKSTLTRCKTCENNCLLTINQFTGGRRFISGNRCEKGAGLARTDSDIPNLFAYKYERVFGYESLPDGKEPRGTVGIPRVLNMYEDFPLWHTFFTKLGYRVKLSPKSSRAVYEKGLESMPSESVCYPAKLVHGHIKALIDDGIDFIWYPSVNYERAEREGTDAHYNCPIVTSYPENIRNNMEEIREIDFRNPFINLNDKKSLGARLCAEFPNIGRKEIFAALDAAWDEMTAYRGDVRKAGEEALAVMEKRGLKGIVLAGRPYHADPEINHGIAEMITGYGAAVLTEDSVAHIAEPERPLGVRDQWVYHSRLYAAAAFARERPDIELVQLNSFGCGLDAVTSDEVSEILKAAGKIYTLIKIDEVNNLGSARIRIRSLFAAMKERDQKGIEPKAPTPRIARPMFTKAMREAHTILCPQMAPIQFDLLQEAFTLSGYNLVIMGSDDKSCIETGLRYVNNDACYPALIVVGQLMNALLSGEYDVNNVSLLMTQTGGGCRASNYVGFIRKALEKAGLAHIPVVSVNAGGLEKNPGWTYSLPLANRALMSLAYGDLLSRVLLRTRPYELDKGSADALYTKWIERCKWALVKGGRRQFAANVYAIVRDFDNLQLSDMIKPRVGVVGEILVKYHPIANNDVVALLEAEGVEAVVPDLLDFLLYSFFNQTFKRRHLGGSLKAKVVSDLGISALEFYRREVKRALRASKRFDAPPPIRELAKMAEPIVSIGNQTGEGWFLTAEMVELIHSGCANIVCVQPFACLPNHVTGKGIMKELKRRYPKANIVAVDYDPGASEVNQINRIKLMLSSAKQNLGLEPSAARPAVKEIPLITIHS